MPKWEQSLLNLIEKHMYILAVLMVSVLALYLRKVAVWWNYAHIIGHFDYHPNHTETSLFYVLLHCSEYLPILPLHSFKWLGGLSDFLLAALCAIIGGQKQSLKKCILFLLCLFSPVCFLRGIVWALPDSTALCFLLGGYLLLQKNHLTDEKAKKERGLLYVIPAVFLAGIGICLQPALLLPCACYFLWLAINKKDSKGSCLLFCVCLLVALILQLLCTVLLKEPLSNGIYGLLRFGTVHPLTGELYQTPGEWLYQMALLYSLPLSILSLLHAAKRPTGQNITIAVLCQFLGTILFSNCLFYS